MSVCKATGRPVLRLSELIVPCRRAQLPPSYLCPRLWKGRSLHTETTVPGPVDAFNSHSITSAVNSPAASDRGNALDRRTAKEVESLPLTCPGCGALSQVVDASQPGHYSPRARKAAAQHSSSKKLQEQTAIQRARESYSPELLRQLGIPLHDPPPTPTSEPTVPDPICDRCHFLVHHNTATPIIHPTLPSLQETIADSPRERNHVYHVLDAADFPLSLLPNLPTQLLAAPLRSQNRRSKAIKYKSSRRQAELSFIITRSDLLAPTKPQVDRMMPVLIEILRDALGRSGADVRLGNVRCVSPRRDWWTGTVREEIYARGGANWMVGLANVGKSRLFREIYPKGRMQPSQNPRSGSAPNVDGLFSQRAQQAKELERETQRLLHEGSLLPPAQPESMYPVMPTISALPGTTASPIRVPFGSGKGELIDLPGLPRKDLAPYVDAQHRTSLVMTVRPKPTQFTLFSQQSLLLGGGLVRITPTPLTEGLVFLCRPFLPAALGAHVTRTEKALEMETFPDEKLLNIPSVVTSGTRAKMRSAGVFRLKWDVTKLGAGPLTRKDAGGIGPERLPFKVMSTDVLIEGAGWLEIVCQVRKNWRGSKPAVEVEEVKPMAQDGGLEKVPLSDTAVYSPRTSTSATVPDRQAEEVFPEVEIFSPDGKCIAQRRPLQCYDISKLKLQPRRSTFERQDYGDRR